MWVFSGNESQDHLCRTFSGLPGWLSYIQGHGPNWSLGQGLLADLGTWEVSSSSRERGRVGAVDVRYGGVWRYGVEGIMAASESPGFGYTLWMGHGKIEPKWETEQALALHWGLAQRGRDQRKQKAT